jgi:MFS family permease
VTRLVTEAELDDRAVADVVRARDGVVGEEADGDGTFALAEGPVWDYRRTVEVEPLGGGRSRVRQEVEYRLAVPYFGFLFALPIRSQLRRLTPARLGSMPWWHPNDRFSRRSAGILASLAVLSIVTSYMGTLLSQTITYAADEFGVSRSTQGLALASVRTDVVLSVALVLLADRRGRRPVLLGTIAAGCVLTALGAASPSIAFLAASQIAARGCVTASGVVIAIIAAEEMPSNSRAYAVSLLAMSAGLGSGIAVMALPLADLGEHAWRLLFAGALLGLPVLASVARRLPESQRFTVHRNESPARARVRASAQTTVTARAARSDVHSGYRSRLILLAVSALLLSIFVAPASQFQNEFLRTERHFSASRISLFTLFTNTPGGLGIVVGGRLADVRGRRVIGALGLVLGIGATVIMYAAHGWPLWAWSVFGAVTGAAVIPALGVYGPELFPTMSRGRANGIITAAGRAGSVIGLVAVGLLSSGNRHIGPALALLSLAPVALAVLIVTAYPETAHLELEDINPGDAPPPPTSEL